MNVELDRRLFHHQPIVVSGSNLGAHDQFPFVSMVYGRHRVLPSDLSYREYLDGVMLVA